MIVAGAAARAVVTPSLTLILIRPEAAAGQIMQLQMKRI